MKKETKDKLKKAALVVGITALAVLAFKLGADFADYMLLKGIEEEGGYCCFAIEAFGKHGFIGAHYE